MRLNALEFSVWLFALLPDTSRSCSRSTSCFSCMRAAPDNSSCDSMCGHSRVTIIVETDSRSLRLCAFETAAEGTLQ